MNILIAGLSKTGTTGLLYLIVNSLGNDPSIYFEPECCPKISSGNSDSVIKVLIGPKLKCDTFKYLEKKITIIRDPRDKIVSSLLYSQYHANYLNDSTKIKTVLKVLRRKEINPSKISIREIMDVVGDVSGKPRTAEHYRARIKNSLDWFDNFLAFMPETFLYKYEDFVVGDYAKLENYLGFQMSGEAEVPEKLKRVSRTKGSDNWRNWFTEEDVDFYEPILSPWLARYGYAAEDWRLNDSPMIQPQHCSKYFLQLIEEQRELQGYAKEVILTGKIVRASPSNVSGWVIGSDNSVPTEVLLIVNGIERDQTLANKERPGLKKRGIHPTGNCGFNFKFKSDNMLSVGDEVVVRPVSGKFHLNNSPCLIHDQPTGKGK